MNILFFSIFFNIIILLIVYFYSNEKKNNLKTLIYFGIFIGFSALSITYLFDSCFGESTPINVKTQNLTDQNLKIYTISFWDNYGNGIGNYVNYDSELEPNETSEFCMDNDGGKFWLIAKNNQNEIIYLKEFTNAENYFNCNIEPNQTVEIEKIKIAQELTFNADKNLELEKYLVWFNVILIILLIIKVFQKVTN